LTLTLNSAIIKSMKQCPRCKEITDNFAINKSRKDGLQVHCRKCVKEANAAYYKATPEKNPARVASTRMMRQKAKVYVRDYLLTHPCVDCGETDILVLEFDHVRGKKIKAVSTMIQQGLSTKTIQSEIDKCEVRCANDHRRVTAKRGEWWKAL
jgi:predicted RNA-binding Zn-ribbon protein involved in translation (DUF1610 family)